MPLHRPRLRRNIRAQKDPGSGQDQEHRARICNTLVGEVIYRPFGNRKQLASYVGLPPAHFQSGAMSRDQGISKAGNAKARTVMIELAWLWQQHRPDSPLGAWFHERVGKLKGRIRRITIVAAAIKAFIA
jgi:transposase